MRKQTMNPAAIEKTVKSINEKLDSLRDYCWAKGLKAFKDGASIAVRVSEGRYKNIYREKQADRVLEELKQQNRKEMNERTERQQMVDAVFADLVCLVEENDQLSLEGFQTIAQEVYDDNIQKFAIPSELARCAYEKLIAWSCKKEQERLS